MAFVISRVTISQAQHPPEHIQASGSVDLNTCQISTLVHCIQMSSLPGRRSTFDVEGYCHHDSPWARLSFLAEPAYVGSKQLSRVRLSECASE